MDVFSAIPPELVPLCLAAFAAGFIDSVVGGGGLIQLPALFIFAPTLPPATLFGTNKLSSICGTSVATVQYARHVEMRWRVALWAAGMAFVCSYFGARLVSLIPKDTLRPAVLVLLILVAIYTAWKKDFGSLHAPKLSNTNEILVALALGAGLGFYDGFFGPGTGSFLIFGFIGLFGFDFLRASAAAKVVNLMTNTAALCYFAPAGHVVYSIGLPMGAFNILGAVLGTRFAILKGSAFIRVLFLVIIAAVILKFAFDTFNH
jgi:uncharacterized protein